MNYTKDKRYYFKRRWNECRGDAYDSWGASLWYFETNQQGEILRQLELYDSGHILRYSHQHPIDDYGGLGIYQLDLNEFEIYGITNKEFEKAWK